MSIVLAPTNVDTVDAYKVLFVLPDQPTDDLYVTAEFLLQSETIFPASVRNASLTLEYSEGVNKVSLADKLFFSASYRARACVRRRSRPESAFCTTTKSLIHRRTGTLPLARIAERILLGCAILSLSNSNLS